MFIITDRLKLHVATGLCIMFSDRPVGEEDWGDTKLYWQSHTTEEQAWYLSAAEALLESINDAFPTTDQH